MFAVSDSFRQTFGAIEEVLSIVMDRSAASVEGLRCLQAVEGQVFVAPRYCYSSIK